MNECSQICWNCDLFFWTHTANPIDPLPPPPLERLYYLARIKVWEQKFHITGHFDIKPPRYKATLDIPPPSIYRHPRYIATLDISPQISVNKQLHCMEGWHCGSPADSVSKDRTAAVVLLLQFCSTVVCSNAPSYWPCFDTNGNVFCDVAICVLYFFVLKAWVTPDYVSRDKD